MGNKNSKAKKQPKGGKSAGGAAGASGGAAGPSSQAALEESVMLKLKKGNRQAQGMPEDELKEWARSLCVKSDLIEWYLNPEFATTVKIFSKLDEVQAQAVNGKSGGGGVGNLFKSTSDSGAAETNRGFAGDDDDDAFNDIDFDIDDIQKESSQPHMKVGKKIKVKLVVAEIAKSDAQKAIRKMLSPILTRIDHQQQFGMFHSALVIGPWYLEWNNSSLCIPRKCYSSAAMLAADLEMIGPAGKQGFELETTIDRVADVIIEWNTSRQYDQRKCNCQQFIDEMCQKLSVNLNFTGPLGEYLQQLREKGECELAFFIPDDMREKFEIQDKKKSFDTHKELDDFVRMLVEKEPRFEEDFAPEWLLLKSFDRAFWLRHFKHADNPKYTPHDDCPFGDPTASASFKREWF